LDCEDYYYQDANCAAKMQTHAPPDRTGSDASPGIWVDRRIPIQVSTARPIYNFMGAVDDAAEYWINVDAYSKLLNDHKASAPLRARPHNATNQVILAVGTFYINGNVTLDDWYILPEGELSVLASGPYSFEYQDASGGVLYQQSFDVSFNLMGTTLTESPFVFTIPYVAGTAKIVVKQNDVPKAQKVVSSNAPTVTVTLPNGGEQFSGQAMLQWSGSDADGDALSYAVLSSPDNGATWETIVTDLTTTSDTWDLSHLPTGAQY
jgi:hypothetical protein